MRLHAFAAVVMAITLLAPTCGMAKGGSDMHNTLLSASVAATPEVFPTARKLGCGSHRHYDPQMHKCRGPGDF